VQRELSAINSRQDSYLVCSNNLKQSSLNSIRQIHASIPQQICSVIAQKRIYNKILKRQVNAFVEIMFFTMFEISWQKKQIKRSRHRHYDTLWPHAVCTASTCILFVHFCCLIICNLLLLLSCSNNCTICLYMYYTPACPPIDSVITLMSVWRITGKIIRTTIMLITYIHYAYNGVLTFLSLAWFLFCVLCFCKGFKHCNSSVIMCLCAFCLERPSP